MYENHYHHAAPDHVEPFHAEHQQHQEPQVVAAQEEASEQPGREADPYEVIDFLLKKVEEQQSKLNDQDGFIELQNQEIEQIKGQFESTQLDLNSTKQAFETACQALDTTKTELENAKLELERQLADYDVLMQNTLAVEHELDQFKAKVTEKPTIKLPFHAEQKLAKLGYGEPQPLEHLDTLEDRQAV